MVVISDTSPISNLLLIDRLDILAQILNHVIVPPAVDREINALEDLGVDISSYHSSQWVEILVPSNMEQVDALSQHLDLGEAEAIVLAQEIDAQLLVIDERAGTKVARSRGLTTIGLVGILLKAKERGLIPEVGAILQLLREKAGFWIGEKLLQQVLTKAGESES